MLGFSAQENPQAQAPMLDSSQVYSMTQGLMGPRTEIDNQLTVRVEVPQGLNAQVEKTDSNGGNMRAETGNYAFVGAV